MTVTANTAPLGTRVAAEVRELLRLCGPLLANNLAIAGMAFADTVMAGRLGARDLAAVAVGSSLWLLALLLGLGTLMGLNPITAHFVGAETPEKVGPYFRQGLWLSQALALLLIVVMWPVEPVLRAAGVDPSIVGLTSGYVHAIMLGLPGGLAYLSLRFISEGIGRTRPVMYCALVGLAINVALNYVLMFGKLGFPHFGAIGCGIASAIALWCMLGAMLLYVRWHSGYRPYALFERWEWPKRALQRELLAVGFPIGAALLVEEGLFTFVGVLMGTLGAAVAAAHQIALNYATTAFMVPLAVHSATIIRVGQAMGAGKYDEVRLRGFTGIALCGTIMLCSAIALLLFSKEIVGFYTNDPAVRDVAVSLLLIAAIFQVSDGLSLGGAGALRGLKDTRVPMYFCIVAYWVIGLPLAWWLGIGLGLGPRWVWVGFVAGLTTAALLLNARFIYITRPERVRPLGMRTTISTLPGG
jgi:MATE family multidrug resistance protein